MGEFERITQKYERVQKLMKMLETIDTSAKSNKATAQDVRDVLLPVAEKLDEMRWGDGPRQRVTSDTPTSNAMPKAEVREAVRQSLEVTFDTIVPDNWRSVCDAMAAPALSALIGYAAHRLDEELHK